MHFSSLTAFVTVLSSVITFVNARAAVTAPLDNAAWEAGSTHIITWVEDNKEPLMSGKFNIALMQGESITLQLISNIAEVDASAGQYKWEIPATQAPGKDYAIRLGSDVYSPHFAITSGTSAGGNNTSSAPVQNSSSTSSSVQNTSTSSSAQNPSTGTSTKSAGSTEVVTSSTSVAAPTQSASSPAASTGTVTSQSQSAPGSTPTTPGNSAGIVSPNVLIGAIGAAAYYALQH